MPRFRYRMQSILDIKLKLEEQARNEYAQAQSRLAEEIAKMEEVKERLRGYEDEARALRETVLNVRELNENHRAVEVVKEYLSLARTRVRKAQELVEEKRDKLNQVMQERKMHEKLRERALEEYLEEEKLGESKTVDELTSFTYGGKSRDAEG